eukprot:CAMPEP_0174704342 /NCGR_PEP_ID=MMETSP1094-20130205/7973_1 /TAXON_ID=156173 /ORGANISM="Chrysochromulina brevifilum, Strain UTEX LB 985" /LENGTH=143 /DNA_ID=CAMNT_0015902391 /DNA_START=135 /DNA_END=566 /DNA_ORIENTATION=-
MPSPHVLMPKVSQGIPTPLYDALLAKDLLQLQAADFLPHPTDLVDLITAADVLVYFGVLTELLHAFGRLGAQVLIFSCERASPAETSTGWQLQASGRFAHTREYVEASAATSGFALVSYIEIVPRMENGKPVQGHLFVFERKG